MFAHSLARDLVAEPEKLIPLLLSTVDAPRERAVIRLVAALLKEPSLAQFVLPYAPMTLLMERLVIARPPSLECSMVLEVLAMCPVQPSEPLLRRWVGATLEAAQYATAVAILCHCSHALQEEYLDAVLR